MIVMGIDPGTYGSALVALRDGVVFHHDYLQNEALVDGLGPSSDDDFQLCGDAQKLKRSVIDEMAVSRPPKVLAIEWVESFGMSVGREVFETCRWVGRFEQAFPFEVVRVTRRQVKLHLCRSMKAKDANVRQALMDRFGGSRSVGTKSQPGPLYGISQHKWSALAVAVTYYDTREGYTLETRPSAQTAEF